MDAAQPESTTFTPKAMQVWHCDPGRQAAAALLQTTVFFHCLMKYPIYNKLHFSFLSLYWDQ